jgi:hypothetical protein
MSKMSDAFITIEEMISEGYTSMEVSVATGYPLEWCMAVEERLLDCDEENLELNY